MKTVATLVMVSGAAAGIFAADSIAIVEDGKAAATVVVAQAAGARRGGFVADDATAARVLVEWVAKITGAELPIAAEPLGKGTAIFVGAAATANGLSLDDIESPSREGLRIDARPGRVLIAGQSGEATVRAVARFLERLGCRYFMDGPLGEVFPRTKTLSVEPYTIAERPGFLSRSIWGSQWFSNSLWRVWNGAGGVGLSTSHAWGGYIPRSLFSEKPEFFRMDEKGGRVEGEWLCSSNRAMRELFAERVGVAIEAGSRNPSISPPDGTAYCQCAACRAQDDPASREPSSGRVSMTNRFMDFALDVAERVGRGHPDSILNFYAYADYTQPPSAPIALPANVCIWIAPIRYCRLHAIGTPHCPSRVQLEEVVRGWSKVAQKIAYRTYNYNLAECTVPIPKISEWSRDIPRLKRAGCIGVNFETLPSWHLYGPHIYLSIRLGYSPDADAGAIMDDFFLKFYGAVAGPIMREYWLGIDAAFARLPCHAGSFFAVPLVYTAEYLERCRALLEKARAAGAAGDPVVARRIEIAEEGWRNAFEYRGIVDALARGDFAQAKRLYDGLLERNKALVAAGIANHYTPAYIERFLGPPIARGAELAKAPARVLAVLPDEWRFAVDPQGEGEEKGYGTETLDDSGWRTVKTHTAPLDAQGLPDEKTVLWYRTAVDVPERSGRLLLYFAEVDGKASVYVNGAKVHENARAREPFSVDVTAAARRGRNVVAVRVDHSKITELFLGGIVRPAYLIDTGAR